MFYISEIQTTPPEQCKSSLQETVYHALQKLNIPFERVDTDEAITGDKPFRSKNFSKALGISRVSFAPAELMEKMLDAKIGAATVFSGLIDSENNVQIVFDADVLKDTWYGCSDGMTTGYMKLRTEDVLHKLLPFTHHNPQIIEV